MDFNGVPLSQAQTMQIALGQDVTDESGNTLKTADKFDVNMRRSAIQKASKIATVDDAHKLIDNAPSMSAIERKTIVSSLTGSSALSKAPYLGGKTLGYITSGFTPPQLPNPNTGVMEDVSLSDYAALETIRDGKITAETLANGDRASTNKLLAAAQSTAFGSVERKNLAEAYKSYSDPNSRLKERVVAGSQHDANIQGMRSL